MKRSEMVSLFQDKLSNWLEDHVSESEASKLLEFLEDRGMTPPSYFDIEFFDEPECDGMIPEWEPE